jgi:hypothetical protein
MGRLNLGTSTREGVLLGLHKFFTPEIRTSFHSSTRDLLARAWPVLCSLVWHSRPGSGIANTARHPGQD